MRTSKFSQNVVIYSIVQILFVQFELPWNYFVTFELYFHSKSRVDDTDIG